MNRSLFALALVLLLAPGCAQSNFSAKASATPTAPVTTASAEVAKPRLTYTAAPPAGKVPEMEKLQAIIETPRGNIRIKFYPKEAPKTVTSFIKLSRDGFYDGLTFHRVEPGFVVQGGDPQGDGSGGPGYTLPAEFNAHKHVPGAVAMARTMDPNSAGSQFYIVLGEASHLDNQYTVFGQVLDGQDVAEKLQPGDSMKIKIEPLKP